MTDLRRQMIREMQLRNLAAKTQKAYLFAVTKLAQHYHRSPDQINEKEVQDYLLYEQNERKLSWSSINQKINGLVFFYRKTLKRSHIEFNVPPRKREQRLPEVLSLLEVERLFNGVRNPKHQMILKTAYAGGLRLSEVIHLKVSDLDSERMMIRVEQGKGNKDRNVPLSVELLEELRGYWKLYRPKTWLFPGADSAKPIHESSVQKTYARAKAYAGIRKSGGIHTLRHCYATHLLEDGKTDIRTIQAAMGHRFSGTTMRYLQIAERKLCLTPSPYDLLKRRRR